LDKDAIFVKLQEFLVEDLKVDADLVSPERNLRDDLQLDSFDIADLLIGIEDRIGQRVDPSILKKVFTIQDLVDFVQPMCETSST
jgi:acyl carrier protein